MGRLRRLPRRWKFVSLSNRWTCGVELPEMTTTFPVAGAVGEMVGDPVGDGIGEADGLGLGRGLGLGVGVPVGAGAMAVTTRPTV